MQNIKEGYLIEIKFHEVKEPIPPVLTGIVERIVYDIGGNLSSFNLQTTEGCFEIIADSVDIRIVNR